MRSRLRIEKLVYGGSGLARHGDTTVFVPLVLPGEEVEVELPAQASRIERRPPIAWISRSPERCEPPCPVFGQCGGCHYQHFEYERECELKVQILRETLRRIGGLDWEGDIRVVAGSPWRYRNRTRIRLARRSEGWSAGFFASGSHRHVGVGECTINSPKLNELHRCLQRIPAGRRLPKRFRTLDFFTDEEQVQLDLPRQRGPLPNWFRGLCLDCLGIDRAVKPLVYQCGPDSFRVSRRSFFQVNRFLADKLAGLAIGSAEGRLALDLYCGVGLISLPLARKFQSVVGVDSSAPAVRDLRSNAARASLAVRAVRMEVGAFLEDVSDRPDLVVADPPRAGLGGAVVEQLLRVSAPQLHVVSCDPATLARDIKGLVAGGYRVRELALIDFFPQTYHIESVAMLARE